MELSTFVTLLVLLAAVLHATWNAIVKSSPGKFFDTVAITTGSALISVLAGRSFRVQSVPATWQTRFGSSPAGRLAVAFVGGVIIMYGARMAGGCTSGHGVCGLSRLSPRSLVATLAFMGAGFVTVYVVRHLLGA